VKVYHELTNLYPHKSFWPILAETIGDDLDALRFWKRIISVWLEMGWSPMSVPLMIDFFRKRQLPGEKDREWIADKGNPEDDPQFLVFWTHCPKQVGKKAAAREWQTLMMEGITPEQLFNRVRNYGATALAGEKSLLTPAEFLRLCSKKKKYQVFIDDPAAKAPEINPEPKGNGEMPHAVRVFQRLANTTPDSSMWSDMDRVVGEDPDALLLWERIVTFWIKQGLDLKRIDLMLEYHVKGIVPA